MVRIDKAEADIITEMELDKIRDSQKKADGFNPSALSL